MPSFNIQRDLIDWVRQGMEKTGINQVELAKAAGTSVKHANEVLNGKARASIVMWQRLVDAAWKNQGDTELNG